MKKDLIYLIVIIVLAGLLLHICNRKKEIKAEAESISEFLNDSVKYYKNKHGQEVAYKKALQGEKAALSVLLSKQIDSTGQLKKLAEKYKRIASAGNITTVTRIDSIGVPYEVPVPFEFERTWEEKNPFYFLSGTANQNGISIDRLEIPNTLSYVIGDKKTGWFSSQYRIEATSSNPFTRIVGLDAYTHKTNESILKIGAQAGFGYTLYGLSPYVGAGVNVDLLLLIKKLF
jgi:hypothetical protein